MEAGVYRVVNNRAGKVLLGSALNLPSMQNKVEFAKSINSPSAMDHRLQTDIWKSGLSAFTFEVVEVLAIKPEMTEEEIREDLAVLENLYREKVNPALLY